MLRHSGRLVLGLILLLALLHGSLYAVFLPPWGLIDEQQHFHYVQHLVEERSIPVVGQTYLSPEIIESLFATRRWEVFHWSPPGSSDPEEMGLQVHSYEGYQPPFFYLLLAPLYAVLPGGVLTKLYALRLAAVCLSLLTIWIAFRTASDLFPRAPWLPYGVALMLALLPERVMAVSRVNNDVLLEVVAAAFIWVWTGAMWQGLSGRNARLMGVLFGLGVLTKASMAVLGVVLLALFWFQRRESDLWKYGLWTSSISGLIIVPWVVRNFVVYGDGMGFGGFRALNETFRVVASPPVTWRNLVSAGVDLFRHFWVVWWKGGSAGANPVVSILLVGVGLLSGLVVFNLLRLLKEPGAYGVEERERCVLGTYLLAVGAYAAAVLVSYFTGKIPIIQGRFFLPVVVPAVLLVGRGLELQRRGKHLFAGFLVFLLGLDTLSLFGNLLPYHYYWSAFVGEGALQDPAALSSCEAWRLFIQRLLRDKPPQIQRLMVWVFLFYLVVLPFAGLAFWRVNRRMVGSEPHGSLR